MCFVELAELRGKLGQKDAERTAWEQSIAADPMNETAAAALLGPYIAERRFADAEPLCSVVIAAAERDRDGFRLYTARRAQTDVGFALGKPDLALTAALAAFEARQEEDEARAALVRAASDMRADPEVLRARDALTALADRPEGLPAHTKVELAEVLGLIGENERSVALFEEVLAEQGDNERALAGLSQHHAASGNRVAALALKRQRAMALPDPVERLEMLLETAEALTQSDEVELAAEVYEAAREITPADLTILHRLLGLYQKARKWVSLFDVLRSIAEVDGEPHRRAKTLFTMGQIAAQELLDRGTALELFDRSLDVDPSQLEAFERIARILTESKDWYALEQMYRKMIYRVDQQGDQALSALLAKQIALVYRDRIGDANLALQALQRAVQLRPDDEEAQAMLRELLSRVGQASGAVAITLDRVLKDPMDPRPYPALFELLASQNARDQALRVASAMNFLDVPHPLAASWRQAMPPPPVEAFGLDLGPDGYMDLVHPELDAALTEIFAVVGAAVVDVMLARLSLRERLHHPGPPLKGQDWLAALSGRAAAVLGAPAPKLYVRRTPGPALQPTPTKAPGLFVQVQALAGVSREAVTFMVGRRIVETTPPFLVRALFPSISELKNLVTSAARIATGSAEPADQPLRERLKRDDVARIARAVETSMSQGGRLDVLRWSQLADLSSAYAGLLLAGDLEAARMALALEPQAPGDLSPRDKMRELVGWFLGDACALFRRRIGVGLV
jgi:tetratricopeptide (TPR) repeat protein